MSLQDQHPLNSGFRAASTTDEVMRGIDLGGTLAIVTGGYSGLGLETVRSFLKAGAEVIVPARDLPRAKAALDGLDHSELEGAQIWPLDLLDPASIDAFAERFLATGRPLQLLVNNAGIMALPERTLDARGHELQFATNHLGHFQLTARLWPALVAAGGARVVSLSSLGHRFSSLVFDDIDFERRPYDPWAAYGQSKTANVLFAVALDRRGEKHGVRAFAVHPGGIPATNLARHLSPEVFAAFDIVDAEGKVKLDPDKGIKTLEQGAATQVWCATSPTLAGLGGLYCENVEVATLLPPGTRPITLAETTLDLHGVAPYAVDPEAAARLWSLSEEWLGLPGACA